MRLGTLLVSLIFVCATSDSNADIAVIAHPDSPLNTLALADIKRFFLKQTQKLPDGARVFVGTLPESLALTQSFYQNALQMNPIQWRTYWAQYEFNGQKSSPQELADQQVMRLWVAQTPGALGFLHVDWVDDSVKVLRTLDAESSPCNAKADCE